MPRAHRLPPITVSHEQVFHAYTSPPIPEKGAPPTIIVTPADPASAQDFQIHSVTPTPSRSRFFDPPVRFSKFFWPFPHSKSARMFGREPVGLDIQPGGEKQRPIVAYNGYSPIPTGAHGAIRLPEDDDQFDGEETFERKERRRSATKKMRLFLFLMLPMFLVSLHLVSAWMGFGLGLGLGLGAGIGFRAVEREEQHSYDTVFHANLWEWGPTHGGMVDDLHDTHFTLVGPGAVVPQRALATATATDTATATVDTEDVPTPVTLIGNDVL